MSRPLSAAFAVSAFMVVATVFAVPELGSDGARAQGISMREGAPALRAGTLGLTPCRPAVEDPGPGVADNKDGHCPPPVENPQGPPTSIPPRDA
jgi:hypothetical protein